MELLLNTQEERCRVAVYNEYLKKIPQLLTQLETVETMYEKALMELEMLRDKDPADQSVALYRERLEKTRQQCLERMTDIRQQSRLIFALKDRLEQESPALRALAKPE